MPDVQQYGSYTWSVPQLCDPGSTSPCVLYAHNYATAPAQGDGYYHYSHAPQDFGSTRPWARRSRAPLQTRVPMACTHCRQRKIKCSGSRTGCEKCVKDGRRCEFTQVPADVKERTRAKKKESRTRKEAERFEAAQALKSQNRVRAYHPYSSNDAIDRRRSTSPHPGLSTDRYIDKVDSGVQAPPLPLLSCASSSTFPSSSLLLHRCQNVLACRRESVTAPTLPGGACRRDKWDNSARLAATREKADAAAALLWNGFGWSGAGVAASLPPSSLGPMHELGSMYETQTYAYAYGTRSFDGDMATLTKPHSMGVGGGLARSADPRNPGGELGRSPNLDAAPNACGAWSPSVGSPWSYLASSSATTSTHPRSGSSSSASDSSPTGLTDVSSPLASYIP